MGEPKHVAIIMDGNGRWATKQNKSRKVGHYYGSENVREIALSCLKKGIKVMTLYTFSTENWKRPQEEIDYLMKLPAIFFERFLRELIEKGIRIETIGDLSKIPARTRKVMENAKNKTKDNDKLILVFAINYGARDELVRVVQQCIDDKLEHVSEADIEARLDTKNVGDVDLMIRTGGDQRLSNYLLWQSAYAELCFVDQAWPEFTQKDFETIIDDFTVRNRTFGGLK